MSESIKKILLAMLALLTASANAQRIISVEPDAIYYNGKVVTVDAGDNILEAFAIRGDRFVAVGTNAEVKSLAGPMTRYINLEGHTVIPGLMDNHNHQYHVALLSLRGLEMQGTGSLEEMLSRLRQAAAAARQGETLYTTMNWDADNYPEGRGPTRRELDAIATDRPIVVIADRGRLHVNSAALDALGLSRGSRPPPLITLGRNDTGELNGLISGQPAAVMQLSAGVVPQPTLDEKKGLIKEMQSRQNAMGLTGIRDLQLYPDVMLAYFDLWREGALTLRVSMGLELNAGEEDRLAQMLSTWGVGSGFGDVWLRLDGIAEYNPGHMMREPYTDTGEIGESRLPEADFTEAIRLMNRHGWRPSIHVVGDRSLDLVLDAYEAADRERIIREKRWVVEHILLVHPGQMDRIKRLGVVVSAQYQPYTRATSMLREWGRERLDAALPMRDLLDRGIIVSGGSDWPGFPNNPFLNIYYYVTRDTLQQGVIGADQKISRMEALRVLSLNNAFLTFDEDQKGSIEPGKLADFLVLSEDILTVPAERIREIRPLATYTGARKVYSRHEGRF